MKVTSDKQACARSRHPDSESADAGKCCLLVTRHLSLVTTHGELQCPAF